MGSPTLLIALLGLSSTVFALQPQKPPNILLIYSDDHACNAVGAYGSVLNSTPNIDRLAAEGVVFSISFRARTRCRSRSTSIGTTTSSCATQGCPIPSIAS